MDTSSSDDRLSRISTLWTVIDQAHAGPAWKESEAQRQLMQRYAGAAYRYLLGALRDEDAAMEAFQEFALRFVRGDFRSAAPDRGRFRDYLKAALRNLVSDRHRERTARPRPLPADLPAPQAVCDDDCFLASWRAELLSQAWEALAAAHPRQHAVLKLHAEQPDVPAAQLAPVLAATLARPVTPGHVRVILHRARARFAELLLAEVRQSLDSPTDADLRDELRALGLLGPCGPALAAGR